MAADSPLDPLAVPPPPATPVPTQAPVVPATPKVAAPAAPASPPIIAPAAPTQGVSTAPPEAPKVVQAPGPAIGVSVAPPPPVPQAPAQATPAQAAAGAATAGQKQAGSASSAASAAGGAEAKAKAKAAASGSGLENLSGEAVKIVERILKGDDPVAAQELNSLVMTQGPRNQAMMQSLAMRLRQSGLDGQGAGNALMATLSAGNEYNNGVLMSQIGERSAQRLMDMTKWGADKAFQLWEKRETQKREDLKTMLNLGQFDGARGLWDDIFPGIPLDTSALQAASPVRKESITARMKGEHQLIAQGNAEGAKAAMLQLAQEMPEMFGYADAASAVAAMQGLDFSTEGFLAKGDNLRAVQTRARESALSGDVASLGAAVDQELALKGAAATEAIAKAALAGGNLEEINAALEAAGLAPVASMDEALLLPKATLAKAVEMARYAKDSRENAVDVLYKDFTRLQPAIAMDPNASRAAKAWIAANVYQLASNPDGTVNIGSAASIQPWAESAPTAHYFLDWPTAAFGEDGAVTDIAYNGMNPYDDQNPAGDLTTPKGVEDARLDREWWKYVMNTAADKRLTMQEWYYATAGGSKPADETKIPAGVRPVKPKSEDPPGLEGAKLLEAAQKKIRSGAALEANEIEAIRTGAEYQTTLANLPKGSAGNFNAWTQAHPDRVAVIDGKVFKVSETGSFENGEESGWGNNLHDDYVKIEDLETGTVYYYSDEGTWFSEKPTGRGSPTMNSPWDEKKGGIGAWQIGAGNG
jgi:hypothetical protein